MSFFPTRLDVLLKDLGTVHKINGAHKQLAGACKLIKKTEKEFKKKDPDTFAILAKSDTRKIMAKVKSTYNLVWKLAKLKRIECPDHTKDVEQQFEIWSNAVDAYGVQDKRTQSAEKNVWYFLRLWLNELQQADNYQKDAFTTVKRQCGYWREFQGLALAMEEFNLIVLSIDLPDLAGAKATAFVDLKDWKQIKADAARIEVCYMRALKELTTWKVELRKRDNAALTWQSTFKTHVDRAAKGKAKAN